MIIKSAINQYLDRPLRNLSELKEWTTQRVQYKISKMVPKPKFYTDSMHHQLVGFWLLTHVNHAVCLFDLGLGKTKLLLDSVRWMIAAKRLRRVLILVPNVVNLESWRIEIAKHAPDLSASFVEGGPLDRRDAIEDETDLCLCTYAGLNHLVCTHAKGKGKKRRMLMDFRKLDDLRKRFDGVVCDECTALMSARSLTFKVVRALSKQYEFRVGLTGTPMGRDPQVLWSQFYAMDGGEALGTTLGLFRQAFFKATPGYWGGVEYAFKKSLSRKLRRMMSHSSIRYSATECLDLPPKVVIESPVVLSDEAWEYYHAVLDRARERSAGGDTSGLDIENVFIRLRQITSGFISIRGEPSPLKQNVKLEALLSLADSLPSDDKLVVFNEFIWSGDQIEKALRDRSISAVRLYSGTRDKQGALRRFTNDAACRVFILNSQSGAQGVNLQTGGCHYVVFYESPVSPIVRAQAEARVWRQGQTDTVFIYDLLCRNTVDQKIQAFLAEGKSLFEALIERGIGLLDDRVGGGL